MSPRGSTRVRVRTEFQIPYLVPVRYGVFKRTLNPQYARVWRFRILRLTWAEPFEMNVKIEQGLNFVVHNDSRLFLDAQEAKKVSERTVDQ